MRETTPGFYGGSYNSVPYRRLYLWTVRERPFYCLGVALRRPPVVKVYILFSTAYARITVLCPYACSSLLRVGQPRLMPRAEKRVIEYFVSTQILQSILDLLHAAGKTERKRVRVRCA